MRKFLAILALPAMLAGCNSKESLPTRTVLIKSEPEGASIIVNNFSLGKAPISVEFETNDDGYFVKKQNIRALPQSAELFTQMVTFPAFSPSNPEISKAPAELTFIMTKSAQEEGGVIKK